MFNIVKSTYSPINNKRITNSASEILIKEIENSISTILFDKFYNTPNNHWEVILMIQMKDTENAKSVNALIENADIKMDGFVKVELQNNIAKNRNNLFIFTLILKDVTYSPIYEIVDI